ncbi:MULTISPECIES: fimbrial protein [Achromobacter]|uniref:Fimbrial protein n=1 Tax=Achromobacter spanius TaxID=217203 RepID=A0ABY8GQV1_9BURK|nr:MULTISPECIES: fimbrial protein [Achromobacter]WAI83803.1 fimbrial protein [Achromobacter spanius]WEX93884.1 fimbrial protein [Achromobacter sp. SS2-2022]WFP06953.1 fimbrial protein [Achromobacter spanius]
MKAVIRQASLALLLTSLGGSAWAACTGDRLVTTITEQQLDAVRPARDAPVGSTIHTLSIDGGVAKVQCTSIRDLFTYGFVTNLGAVPGQDKVYASGIPGIGVRIFWPHEGGVYLPSPMTPKKALGPWEYHPPQIFTIEFIKTGPIQSGVSGDLRVEVRYGSLLSNLIVFNNLRYDAKIRSCLPTKSEQQVDLLPIRARDLGHVGATAAPKAFVIDLACDPGVKVAYRIDAPDQENNVIKNSTLDGMAKGVGLQLLMGDVGSNVVQPLETRTEIPSTPHAGPVIVSIPLGARYYQTEPKITGGPVSATATVTLFYE